MKRMLFVYNPYSGKGQLKNHLNEVLDIFTKAGYLVSAYPTQKPHDAFECVREWGLQYDLIACSGGDGTLNEVISARMTFEGEFPPIGYIPTGSTNDFAISLGIPKQIKNAAKQLVECNTAPIDVGSFNGRYFNYISAFGLFTDTSYKTTQAAKNVLGHSAYVLDGFRSFVMNKAYKLKVTTPDLELQGSFIYGMVANAHIVGGFKGLTGKNVCLNDGLYEVTLVHEPKNPAEFNEIVQAVIHEEENSQLVRFKTSEIHFESETPIPWSLDGEEGGEQTDVVVKVLPRAVTLCVGDRMKPAQEVATPQ